MSNTFFQGGESHPLVTALSRTITWQDYLTTY